MEGTDVEPTDGSNGEPTRRGYLALATMAATGLAGCGLFGGGGDGGDGDGDTDGEGDTTTRPPLTTVSGPATFGRFGIEGPAETVVGNEVTLTVSAANVGSEAGDLQATVTTAEGTQSIEQTASVTGVAAGERTSTDVGVTIELADDYVLRVGNGAGQASHEISATPRTGAIGDALDLGNGLRVTPTDVSYEVGVFYTARAMGASPTAYYAPAGEQVLAVLRFSVENTATNSRRFGANVVPSAGAVLGEYPNGAISQTQTIDGSALNSQQGASIQAGQQTDGWLLAQVPRSAVGDGFAVNWQRDAADTRPEVQWSVDGAALPSFTLAEWTLPGEAAPGEAAYSVTVRNEGDADGVFRGAIDWGVPDGSNWSLRQQLSETIPAGGSHTFERADRWPYVDDRAFRLRPMGETRTVDFTAPTLAVGESLATPFGAITVTNAATGDRVVSSPGSGDSTSTKTPERGQFVLVEVEYSRQFQVAIPNIGRLIRNAMGFLLQHGGSEYEWTLPGGDHDYHQPVSGIHLNQHRGEQIPVGETRRGWLAFDVPASVSLSGATLSWENSRDDNTSQATWELG